MANVRRGKGAESTERGQKVPGKLVVRCRHVLTTQANLLFAALQKLQQYSEGGDEKAGEIWETLVDGIIMRFPDEVFESADFEQSEDISNPDVIAFRQLIDQAKARKAMIEKTSWDNGTGYSGHSSAKMSKKMRKKETEKQMLTNLIDVLQMAADATEEFAWEWKKDEENLKREVLHFNRNLKVTVNLLTEIYKNTDITKILDIVKKFPSKEERTMSSSSWNPTELCSIEWSMRAYIESEKEHSEIDDDDEEASLRVVMNDDENSLPSSFTDHDYCPDESVIFSDVEKEFNAADYDGEDYIVRQSWARIKKSRETSHGSTVFQDPAYCEHDRETLPMPHIRDWKRDGYFCICGINCRFMQILDKHVALHSQQMALMLQCNLCEFRAKYMCCLDEHKKDQHGKPKMLKACRRLYQCGFGCERILKSKKLLFDHQKETGRQCKRFNETTITKKSFPTTVIGFAAAMRLTCMRSDIELTLEQMDEIFSAIKKDLNNMNVPDKTPVWKFQISPPDHSIESTEN